jgi:exodeoxyribonuclease VII small subunit
LHCADAFVTKKPKDKAELAAEANPQDLEKSLAELEKIVAKLEGGDLTLDESLKQFERGVALTRQCQKALRQAEQRVDILLRKSGVNAAGDDAYDAEPFDTELDRDDTP